MTKSLTNLTPSGVERIRAEAFEKMVEAGAKAIMGCNGGFTAWQFWREDARACLTAALALPSEPPPMGDVEGRARELLAAECVAEGLTLSDGEFPVTPEERVAIRALVKLIASKEDGRS